MSGTGRHFWMTGCAFAFLAVALGAFGAHGLRDHLPDSLMSVFETGVRYQMYHALALLLVARLADTTPSIPAFVAGWLFVAGVVVFSGSLYLLSITGLRWLGAVTPLGGVAFLAGWLSLALAGGRRVVSADTNLS